MKIQEVLQGIIEEKGAITYEEYMGHVLYHPTLGYYNKECTKIGASGDFITTSNVSGVFAQMIARFFYKVVQDGLLPPVVCEIGGGTGKFAFDFVQEWKRLTDERLTYIIIETSPHHRQLQRERLGEEVIQYSSLEELSTEIEGFVFSNELFDAFPVHVIEKRNGNLYEIMISFNEQQEFIEIPKKLEHPEISAYLHTYHIELEEGQRFEIPLLMEKYIQKLSRYISKSLVMTIDYGYTFEEWQQPYHRDGSLRGYYKHQMVTNPLLHLGEMDLTTHIHIDMLKEEGNRVGLTYIGEWNQRDFLLRIGILQYLQEHHDSNPFSEASKRNRAIRSLVMSDGMSPYFRVMLQQKNMNVSINTYMPS
ncbi:class I SAM-dependent methyltransferase [Priestia taiwanensis]|uniref:SAM-dependent methyltransferase n=1 Tax=Priestia taiwanensis TaxID=1347902 RepID=A0A917ATX7_9BACI|nr:SAM-dependent methyltransferase [Priestia taiwanensis]MBM7363806.1 SAM-dependent MidA family methyltransferase [Priestia taiwanensis]GGE73962.1 SAM-dependent methyltransferase [Priestia taiwanensis]